MKLCQDSKDHFEEMREHLVKHLMQFSGDIDIQGMELSSLIRVLANYYSAAIMHKTEAGELSGPRMGILLRLFAAEESGVKQALGPTELSHYQNVKKNTISSLLRGLEESGLIERTLDPQDKRAFMIRITKAGKELIKTTGPSRLKMMNDLSSGLSAEEKTQLIALLEKLRKSIKNRADFEPHPVHIHQEEDFTE
jgi:DNA-binding MarR family transcriptional regulator